MPSLVLASGSPRRRELLARFGWPFTVAPADVDETVQPGERADDLVRRLALAKAEAGLAAALAGDPGAGDGDGVVVLAADTVVVVDSDVLGKPVDAADAAAALGRLSGRTHRVLTGVAVATHHGGATTSAAHLAVEVVVTEVDVGPLTEADIAWYVATGEPLDKAGSYGIQGAFGLFVDGIRGSHDNVVGLPLAVTRRLLADAGLGLGPGTAAEPTA